MTGLSLITIATGSYLPGASVTCRSFLDHHPDGRAAILLVDGVDDLTDVLDPRIEVIRIDDLPFGETELTDLLMLYGPLELSCALKPLALLHMLARDAGPVIYLDADIEVLANLDDIAELAQATGIALTPHRLDAVPRDGAHPNEETLHHAGVFNAGFVAATGLGRPMLEWWWQSLRRDCILDVATRRYLDQRALEVAVGLHAVEVVRDPGCNLGYWNADTRPVRGGGPTGWTAAGAPLRFIHFSGFDPTKPWLLRRATALRPRVLLSEAPELAHLCARYAEQLRAAGWDQAQRLPYGHGALADGTSIDPQMRRVYRGALERSDAGRADHPPNPFRTDQVAAFWAMLNEPHPDHPSVTRYQYEVWRARPDVGTTISSLHGSDAERFADWLLDHGAPELHIPPRLLPERPVLTRFRELTSEPPPRAEGLAIAGLLNTVVGVGHTARLVIEAARAAGLQPEVIGYSNSRSQESLSTTSIRPEQATADVVLVCLNPDVLPNFIDAATPRFRRDRYVVGLWFWEVDLPTPSMRDAFDLVDEVWVTTDFVRRALLPIATKPVELVGLPLVSGQGHDPDDPRARLGIPTDRFTFLFSYDSFSVPERKNPLGLATAFATTFAPDEGPLLIIKTINGAGDATTEQLRHLAEARSDIVILDQYLSTDELMTLTATADCYVSLHRSEGWGLTLAEPMRLGTPVIATGYSGNMSFMNEDNSYLVPYDLVAVGPGNAPYPPNAVWAQPDLLAAGAMMRHVWTHPEEARGAAAQAQRDIQSHHTPAATASGLAAAVSRARTRHQDRS